MNEIVLESTLNDEPVVVVGEYEQAQDGGREDPSWPDHVSDVVCYGRDGQKIELTAWQEECFRRELEREVEERRKS